MKTTMIGCALLTAVYAYSAHAARVDVALAPTVLTRGEITHAFAARHRPGRTAQAIAPADRFYYWAVTRHTSGSVEIHLHWTDVIYVRTGVAHLLTGTAVTGDWDTGHGEWRGGRILHPHVAELKAGYMVVIPAGLAHRFIPLDGKPFEYVTIKVPARPPASGTAPRSGRLNGLPGAVPGNAKPIRPLRPACRCRR